MRNSKNKPGLKTGWFLFSNSPMWRKCHAKLQNCKWKQLKSAMYIDCVTHIKPAWLLTKWGKKEWKKNKQIKQITRFHIKLQTDFCHMLDSIQSGLLASIQSFNYRFVVLRALFLLEFYCRPLCTYLTYLDADATSRFEWK